MSIEFPPKKDTARFDDWIFRLWKFITETSSTSGQTNHALLGNLNSTVYSHVTASQLTGLTTGQNTAIHYHATDRDRANHTGTQTASTISDLTTTLVEAIRLKGYTVATLPAAPIQGDTAFVTDALAPAFLVAIAGGGAVVSPVFFNGAAWVAY